LHKLFDMPAGAKRKPDAGWMWTKKRLTRWDEELA